MNSESYLRRVEDCPHRRCNSTAHGRTAVCNLLSKVSGVWQKRFLVVEEEACRACCESFTPTISDWNPTIVSLIHRLAEQVVDAGGIEGCSAVTAAQLADAAIAQLPVVEPDQDDGIDDLRTFRHRRVISLQTLLDHISPPVDVCPTSTRKWAVGITTAPRRQPTLPVCVESLIASGWDELCIHADGPIPRDELTDNLILNERAQPIGAWPAWCAMLKSLLSEHPAAQVVLIVQDDALFPAAPAIRKYVECCLWPDDGQCALSLYTSSEDMPSGCQWQRYPHVWRHGAVAFAFPRDIAEQLLANIDRGDLEFLPGNAGIDTRIGIWADRSHVSVWHPAPSLVQHIGQISSIWQHSRAVGLRRADRIIADEVADGDRP